MKATFTLLIIATCLLGAFGQNGVNVGICTADDTVTGACGCDRVDDHHWGFDRPDDVTVECTDNEQFVEWNDERLRVTSPRITGYAYEYSQCGLNGFSCDDDDEATCTLGGNVIAPCNDSDDDNDDDDGFGVNDFITYEDANSAGTCGTNQLRGTFCDVLSTPVACVNDLRYSITRTWQSHTFCPTGLTPGLFRGDQIISVVDTSTPELVMPADIILECDPNLDETDPAVIGSFSVYDLCDTEDQLTITELFSTSATPCETQRVRTVTVTDTCGNIEEREQTIRIRDTMPPIISEFPADAQYQCLNDVPVNELPVAIDVCASSPNCSPESREVFSGSCLNDATITTRFTCSDGCNEVSQVQTIIVRDTEPPVLTPNSGGVLDTFVDEQCTHSAFTDFTAIDNCGNADVQTVEKEYPSAIVGDYHYERIVTASDLCGNVVTAVQHAVVHRFATLSITSATVFVDVAPGAEMPVTIEVTLDAGSCDLAAGEAYFSFEPYPVVMAANADCVGTVGEVRCYNNAPITVTNSFSVTLQLGFELGYFGAGEYILFQVGSNTHLVPPNTFELEVSLP